MSEKIDVLRTRGLPFSLMTTTHGLLVVSDASCNDLFTYCPHFGVMPDLGDFDDHPRMYTPECLQLFRAPVEDLVRMKQEWEEALKRNTRYANSAFTRDNLPKDAPLPFIPALHAEVFVEDCADDLQEFDRICCEIGECDADGPDKATQNIVNLRDWTTLTTNTHTRMK
jgi:hypothetical protein